MKQTSHKKTFAKEKIVTFAKQVFLILIPGIGEYKEHGIWKDIWMTEEEQKMSYTNLIQEIESHLLYNENLTFQENYQQIYKPKTKFY